VCRELHYFHERKDVTRGLTQGVRRREGTSTQEVCSSCNTGARPSGTCAFSFTTISGRSYRVSRHHVPRMCEVGSRKS
jgi:hypothetical protein